MTNYNQTKYPLEYQLYLDYIVSNDGKYQDKNTDQIEADFNVMNYSLMEPMYNFVVSHSKYFSIRKDYGTGIELTMIEAHILQDIKENPHTTVSSLALQWGKTSSAISQIIKKLDEKGLINRVINQNDRKINNLVLTTLGAETALAHNIFDNKDILRTRKKLLEKFSIEEMIAFDKICKEYTEIIEESNG